jgi:hypothetical protein
MSTETGQEEVFVQSVPAGKGKWRVSTDGGGKPVWDPDGRKLYYLDRAGTIQRIAVRMGATTEIGRPERTFEAGASTVEVGAQFDVDPTGRRFAVISRAQTASASVLVLNWKPPLP